MEVYAPASRIDRENAKVNIISFSPGEVGKLALVLLHAAAGSPTSRRRFVGEPAAFIYFDLNTLDRRLVGEPSGFDIYIYLSIYC